MLCAKCGYGQTGFLVFLVISGLGLRLGHAGIHGLYW